MMSYIGHVLIHETSMYVHKNFYSSSAKFMPTQSGLV